MFFSVAAHHFCHQRPRLLQRLRVHAQRVYRLPHRRNCIDLLCGGFGFELGLAILQVVRGGQAHHSLATLLVCACKGMLDLTSVVCLEESLSCVGHRRASLLAEWHGHHAPQNPAT